MNKTDRINLRAKTALNKLSVLTIHEMRTAVWVGITKAQKNQPYHPEAYNDLDQALDEMNTDWALERYANYL